MSDSGGSGVNALAIVAIVVVLVGAGYWFYSSQPGSSQNVDLKKVEVKVEVPKAPAADPAPATK